MVAKSKGARYLVWTISTPTSSCRHGTESQHRPWRLQVRNIVKYRPILSGSRRRLSSAGRICQILIVLSVPLAASRVSVAAPTLHCDWTTAVICLGNGTVLDRSTSLIWRIRSEEKGCGELSQADRWRQPTGPELANRHIRAVFDLGRSSPYGSLCVSDTLVNLVRAPLM
jgi:hypothetical protein